MKTSIHPKWLDKVTVTCNCGATFTTGSTLNDIKVDICNMCHPFYTGEMKFVDVQGRVEKFQAKQKMAAKFREQKKVKTEKRRQQSSQQKSLQEMLQDAKAKTVGKNDADQATPSKAAPTKH